MRTTKQTTTQMSLDFYVSGEGGRSQKTYELSTPKETRLPLQMPAGFYIRGVSGKWHKIFGLEAGDGHTTILLRSDGKDSKDKIKEAHKTWADATEYFGAKVIGKSFTKEARSSAAIYGIGLKVV